MTIQNMMAWLGLAWLGLAWLGLAWRGGKLHTISVHGRTGMA